MTQRILITGGASGLGPAPAGRIERLQRDDWDWILDINLKEGGKLTADQVAEQVIAAVAKGRSLVLTHPEGRRGVRLNRFLPRLVDVQIAKAWRHTEATSDAQDRQEATTS